MRGGVGRGIGGGREGGRGIGRGTGIGIGGERGRGIVREGEIGIEIGRERGEGEDTERDPLLGLLTPLHKEKGGEKGRRRGRGEGGEILKGVGQRILALPSDLDMRKKGGGEGIGGEGGDLERRPFEG